MFDDVLHLYIYICVLHERQPQEEARNQIDVKDFRPQRDAARVRISTVILLSPMCTVHTLEKFNAITTHTHFIVSGLFSLFFWCPSMPINESLQYNGGLLPDILLLTQCYHHRGTRLNAMKEFCICSL